MVQFDYDWWTKASRSQGPKFYRRIGVVLDSIRKIKTGGHRRVGREVQSVNGMDATTASEQVSHCLLNW